MWAGRLVQDRNIRAAAILTAPGVHMNEQPPVINLDDFFFDLPPPDPDAKNKAIQRCTQAPTAYENWAPAVASAGVSAPDTVMVPLSFDLQEAMLEGMDIPDEFQSNIDDIVKAVAMMGEKHGFPVFIKTSFVSNKHEWLKTCCLASADRETVIQHVERIVGFQGFSDYLVSSSLLVRQMLETHAEFHAFDGQMPVTQEFRFFASKGKVEGYQAYWPEHSIKGQNPSVADWSERLEKISKLGAKDLAKLIEMAANVTRRLEGEWSVDFLKDRHGKWWLIDMAEGSRSFRNEADFIKVDQDEGLVLR
jgi:hypothetical protein